ncbi:hypothetical protein WDW37_15425 [Bdellovibrionota bacterium FG-1]
MNKRSLAVTLFFSAVFLVSGSTPGFSESLREGQVLGKKFSGKVELNTVEIAQGETVVQIIDQERSVVCYGKLSQGGASTISCQKFK